MRPLVLVLLSASAPAAASQDLAALVAKVERHYDSIKDFEAEFTQRYERRFLHKTIEESGRVSVKKPGRMRWEYRRPEEKLFVTDGSSSYFYIPAENQVMVSHHPEGPMGLEKGSPFELLAGESRVTESFSFFSSETPPTEGGVVLRAVPHTHHEEFETVELEVRPDDGTVLRVVLIDSQGNRTDFTFREIRENLDIPESQFRFTVPSGVEVVVVQAPQGAP
ncbi:MAG TPA: outer membrane lipoprotein carrier protein LolA [Vicinamibacteria bacterium]|nr:outer membrane lipoprotein carrier protein LolA [Vicinamibacteria bacterium]